MVILHNEFPQFENDILTVSKEMLWLNFDVNKITIPNFPFPAYATLGRIYINPEYGKEEKRSNFRHLIIHEGDHLFKDPINFQNYMEALEAIEESLDIKDDNLRNMLGNISSDIIIEHYASQHPVFRSIARTGIEALYGDIMTSVNKKMNYLHSMGVNVEKADKNAPTSDVTRELFALYGQFYDTNYKNQLKSKYYDDVMRILKSTATRPRKYVELSRLFKEVAEQDLKKMTAEVIVLSDKELEQLEQAIKRGAIIPTSGEVEDYKRHVIIQSRNSEEAKKRLERIEKMLKKQSKSIGFEEGKDIIPKEQVKFLKQYYTMKARSVLLSIAFPRVRTIKGVRLGTESWQLGDTLQDMNVRRTLMKFGVNIPLVTTRKSRILKQWISDIKDQKPLNVVVAVDCSGSTGWPSGDMVVAADYEVIMFYALLDLAKRIDQKVGLYLWEARKVFYQDPLDWKEQDKLREKILAKWSDGGTLITPVLDTAVKDTKSLYFVVTDGDVFHSGFTKKQLKDYYNKLKGRVHFFLVLPYGNYDKVFKEVCGKDITIVTDITKIPHIVIQNWRDYFW